MIVLVAGDALAETLTITVTGANGQPVAGAPVRVIASDGRTSDGIETTTQTGSDGTATVDVGPGDAHVTVFAGDRLGSRSTTVRTGQPASVTIGSGQMVPAAATADASMMQGLVDAANRAADACDRAAYQRALEQLDSLHASLRANLVRRQAELDGFRKSHGLNSSIASGLPIDSARAFTREMHGSDSARQAEMRGFEAEFRAILQRRNEARTALETFERIRALLKLFPEECDKEKKVGHLPGIFAPGSGAGTAAPGGGMMPASAVAAENYGFYGGVEGGVLRVERPSNSFFRVDAGGSFKSFPALKFNNDDTTGVGRAFLGYRIPTPSLKERSAIGLELHGWYYSGSSRGSQSEFTPGAGETLGLFSPATQMFPFGGYSTGQPLRDISARSEYSNYGGEFRVQRWCDYDLGGPQVVLEPWLGFRLGHTKSDQSLTAGIGNPAFTSYSQSSDIGSTFFGPSLGVGARYELGNGMFLFGKLGASLDFHRGSGSWSTIVPLVDGDEARAAKLSNNKTGFTVGGAIGAGYRINGIELRGTAEITHSNSSPYLKFASPSDTDSGTGGATIGYGSQTSYGFSFGAQMKF
jgi:hypothetical protein